MEIETRLAHEIVDLLTRVSRPDRIILFGSGTTGGMTQDSDIDVLVLQPEVQNIRDESRRLRRALAGLGVPIDLLVMGTASFEQTKSVIGGIAYPANKYGKVIYEASR